MSLIDEIKFEIAAVDKVIDEHAASYGMDRNAFFRILDSVHPETARSLIPLLNKRIALFKRVWALMAAERRAENVFLFSNTK